MVSFRRLAAPITLAGLVSVGCGDGEATGVPRSERLEILTESPDFEDRAPFVEVRPTEWERATVRGDLRTVEIFYESGNPACFGADHAEAVYEERAVVLTLFAGRTNGVCTLEAVQHVVTVRLSEPVLDRELVDGAASRQGS